MYRRRLYCLSIWRIGRRRGNGRIRCISDRWFHGWVRRHDKAILLIFTSSLGTLWTYQSVLLITNYIVLIMYSTPPPLSSLLEVSITPSLCNTRFNEAIAHSIILSSGSRVVKPCKASPGARSHRTKRNR